MSAPTKRMREKNDFPKPIQSDLGRPVLHQKIFPFPFYPNHLHIFCRLVPQRGGSRSSRTRGGMRWTRAHQARERDGRAGDQPVSDQTARGRMMVLADGEVVWS